MTKTKKTKEDFSKGEKLKKTLQIILDTLVLGLLLFYMIHINFGIGMQKINLDIKTDCQGTIQTINGIPENTTINVSQIQRIIYQQINNTKT